MSSLVGPRLKRRGLVAVLATGFLVSTSIDSSANADPAASSSGAHRVGSGTSASSSAIVPFSLIFQDDFNGSVLNPNAWCVFNGPGKARGPKSASNVFVSNGAMVLRAQKINGEWYGAGVCNTRAVVQTYGKYTMRVRFGAGKGVRTSGLLWPYGGGWPPEVDFYEIEGRDPQRTNLMLTNHYRDAFGRHMQHGFIKGNYTQWHIVGVEWRPTSLTFKIDGVVVKTMTGHVPQQSMWFGMNVALGTGANAPDSTTPAHVDAQVDWIRIFKYNGAG